MLVACLHQTITLTNADALLFTAWEKNIRYDFIHNLNISIKSIDMTAENQPSLLWKMG